MQSFRCNYNSMFYIYGAEQGAGYAYGCLRDCISGIFAAGSDGFSVRQTEKKRKGRGIQELLLLDEEGNEISAWHIGGKTSLLIGRDEHKENVDINLQNTEYGGMADRQHAVLNYAAGQWYIEDLGSRNGVRIQDAKDGKVYQVSREHPCRINAGDIIFIGNTRLGAK